MTATSKTDPEIDNLIYEITVDCHDQDEQLMGFANAFDDVDFPYPATVIGEDAEVHSVSLAENRPELIATCTRAGRTYDIALLDIDSHVDANTSRLIAAYRRWTAYR
jgi:hypothetical protein